MFMTADSPCGWVGTLEIIDELGQILDGVDVVVGRGGDETYAGHRVSGPGYLLFQNQLVHSVIDLTRSPTVDVVFAENQYSRSEIMNYGSESSN